MRYVSAYLLAVLGGKEKPTVADIENILGSVGVDTDQEKCKMVVSRLSGKSIDELINEGSKHLVSISAGGGGGSSAGHAAPVAAVVAKVEEKKPVKEEKKEESEEEDMGFGLFD